MAERVLLPDEWASEEGVVAWVSRDEVPDALEAVGIAFREAGETVGPGSFSARAVPVLLREESKVEARIRGHEFPLWVQCTSRAKAPVPYWRVEHGA